ncbi:MAG TPA: Hsp20/alpha crystallin family protein [Longimicrobiales bacterium]|nr:Hsp20/alpha crystallin family protein [Longimicrobiales bacterium]
MVSTAMRPTTDMFRFLFDDVVGSTWGGRGGANLLRTPNADVVETTEDLRVVLELPGMRPEDIEVNLEHNVLTISGEKKETRAEGDEDTRWHLSELRYGRFSRSFVLPRDVEQDDIKASFDNGMLNVVIPKSEKVKPRRIEVRGGNSQRRIEASSTN